MKGNYEYAIEVKHVSKHFKIYFDKGYSLRDKLLFWNRNRYEELKVLQDISFSIRPGEAVGLIGHNGCGKSTTLKMLSRIMYPDAGEIIMNGRVSSLLELGAGFHPDMTGRENIYINASIFGLTKKEIDHRINDIIAFAELGDFLNNPVRTYSSGMYMRLAFAVAINVNADILLIDEILAVGDVNFRAKCLKKLKEIREGGTTIILVSHSLGQIEEFCKRTIWIHNGKIQRDGTSKEVHKEYLEFMKTQAEPHSVQKEILPVIKIVSSKLFDGQKKETACENIEMLKIENSGILRLEVSYEVMQRVEGAVFIVRIYNNENILCYETTPQLEHIAVKMLEKTGIVVVTLSEFRLQPGKYRIAFLVKNDEGINLTDKEDTVLFQITGGVVHPGIAAIDARWTL